MITQNSSLKPIRQTRMNAALIMTVTRVQDNRELRSTNDFAAIPTKERIGDRRPRRTSTGKTHLDFLESEGQIPPEKVSFW